MGASKSTIHCPYYVYGLCEIRGCRYKHDETYRPNIIEILWHYPTYHPEREFSIYTVDFNYFCTGSNGNFEKYDRIFRIKDLKSIYIYEHTGIMSHRINLEAILPRKKSIFYNLLHKYMIIKQIFAIDDVSICIALLMKSDKTLITKYK